MASLSRTYVAKYATLLLSGHDLSGQLSSTIDTSRPINGEVLRQAGLASGVTLILASV